jgi:DNA repair exonuclease SbcCD ATPase subunit
VPYASVSQLNLLLSQIEQMAQATQLDLAKLRIDKWKTDSNTKRSTEADVESLQRNLQMALPELIAQLRSSPENISATFKLYRNLDALYDVFGPVVESAGAFGSRDEFQSVQNDLSALERSRRSLAERMEALAGAKEGELAHLRTQVRDLQAAAVPPAPPKKVVVDDTEPPKKITKKKTVPRPPKPSTPATTQQPGTTTSSQPPSQQPQQP